MSTAGSIREAPHRSEGIGADGIAGTVASHHDPLSATSLPGKPLTTVHARHLVTPMVSASTLGFRTEISFGSPGDPARSPRTRPAVAPRPQAPGPEWLLLRLADGNITVAGSDIGVEALTTQLVIQRCLTHPRHRRDALATTASTSCG